MFLTFKLATWSSRKKDVLPCNFEIPPCKTKSWAGYDRLELWASDMTFVCNMSSCHKNQLCHIIYKSQHRWLSDGQTRTSFTEIHAHSFSEERDIDLTTWFLFLTHCFVMMIICTKLFSNPTMHDKVTVLTWRSFSEAYAQSLRVDWDLDL